MLVVLHLGLACAGFFPAVQAFQKRGKWFVNPVKRPEEWGSDHHSTMKAHAIISLAWIGIAVLQYVVTPQLMMTASKQMKHPAKKLHRVVGYIASALLVAFVINANYLTWKNGVAGLVLYNFLALITGSMMLWHLVRAMQFIWKRQVREHINQMCGLLCWTCYPGIIRLVAIVPYQMFLYDDDYHDCDAMNTSGMMVGSFPVSALGLIALRWAATGEKFQHSHYMNFYVLIAADFLIGWLGNTLFQCHPSPQGALLEQVPGKAWALKRWYNDTDY